MWTCCTPSEHVDVCEVEGMLSVGLGQAAEGSAGTGESTALGQRRHAVRTWESRSSRRVQIEFAQPISMHVIATKEKAARPLRGRANRCILTTEYKVLYVSQSASVL